MGCREAAVGADFRHFGSSEQTTDRPGSPIQLKTVRPGDPLQRQTREPALRSGSPIQFEIREARKPLHAEAR